jgi:hypothetical protein
LAAVTRKKSTGKQGTDRYEEPPVPLWPVWKFRSGYAQLAKYVTPEAILADPGLRVQLTLEEAHLKPQGRDRIRARRLYDRLREIEMQYDHYPWASREGTQQIRHPWWLVSGRYGNCLDLSLTYAGMCLAANTGVLLALTERHAFVVLTPGRLHLEAKKAKPFELDGFSKAKGSSERGVLEGSGAALSRAIKADTVKAVDLVAVTRGSDFKAAAAEALSRWKEDEQIHLVDLAYLRTKKRFAEFPHPVAYRPSVRLRVPSGGGEFRKFAAHAGVITKLEKQDGMHVLIGDRGRGKSTIARHLAETPKTARLGSSMPPTAKPFPTAWPRRCSRRSATPSSNSSIPRNAKRCGKRPTPTCATRKVPG